MRHAAAHLSSAALGMLAAVNVYLTASILGQDWPSAQDTLPQQRQDEDSDANHRPDLSDIIGLLRYDIFLRGWSRRFLPALRRVKGPSPQGLLGSSLRLQLYQQLLDLVFFLERGEAVFHLVGGNF